MTQQFYDELHGEPPLLRLNVKDGTAYAAEGEWKALCAHGRVPTSWVVAAAQILAPSACLTVGPFLVINIADWDAHQPASFQPSTHTPAAALVGQLIEQGRGLSCTRVALRHPSPLDALECATPIAMPDDDVITLICCRLVEQAAPHGVGDLPDDLFSDGENARRLLVLAAFVSASVHSYLTKCVPGPVNRSITTRASELCATLLFTLAGSRELPVSRQGYRPHFVAIWNLLLRDYSGILAEAVRYLDYRQIVANRHDGTILRAVAIRLRVLADMIIERLVGQWEAVPNMPADR